METQWYLCRIDAYPKNEAERLKKTDNLSVKYPDAFIDFSFFEDKIESNKKGEGDWYVWLPIIPRVGDTLQFTGWQVQVSQVILSTDWHSDKGIQKGLFVSAIIKIRDNVVPYLMGSSFAIENQNNEKKFVHEWENYARRGHDLQYYAWELKNEFYLKETRDNQTFYYQWHTRIRPVAGDIVTLEGKRWRIQSVELASPNNSVDGYLILENCD